jgi:hypothetical protein
MMLEFQALSIRPEYCQSIVTHCLLTNNSTSAECARRDLPHHPNNQFSALPIDCFWQDPAALEEILPDSGVSKALTNLITGAT